MSRLSGIWCSGLVLLAAVPAACHAREDPYTRREERPPPAEPAARGDNPPASPSPPAAPPPASAPPAPTAPPAESCGGCAPGQTCRDGRCIADCRDTAAVPCASPLVCDYQSGACLQNGRGCSLAGKQELCGRIGYPLSCGPGTRCDAAMGGCVSEAGCRNVICDVAGFCRGSDCPEQGGGVRSLTLEPIADAAAGARMAIRARARVDAERPCSLTVTYELRRDSELYVSAFNDRGIWRVPLPGASKLYLRENTGVTGLAADRTGTLYYALRDQGAIFRVRPGAGAPVKERFATVPVGINRMTFGPDGLLYAVQSTQVLRIGADGTVLETVVVPSFATLSGLAFDRDGSLIVGELFPRLFRRAPGAAMFTIHADARAVVPASTEEPYHQGIALGPDGLVYVGVFPTTNDAGMVYRLETPARLRRVLGLEEIRRSVPETLYAGIHGLAFGADGTLYFVNQNTRTNTREPLGQVLALRPSGKIELIAAGLNVDWGFGFDGDIVVAQQTVATLSAPLDSGGVATGLLDAPTRPGVYGVRALVSDPVTGSISESRGAVLVF